MFRRIKIKGVAWHGKETFMKPVFGSCLLQGNRMASKREQNPSQPPKTPTNLLTPQFGG